MKKCAVCTLLLFLLNGCRKQPNELEVGMELRSAILQSSSCSFTADITADYGEQLHIFSMNCQGNSKGDVSFTIEDPESISGIGGSISGDGGMLSFDDTALHFELLADGQLSPVSAPWILLKTLRGGYLTSACTENGKIRLSVDDSYEANSLNLDIWLNAENKPEQADILYDGRRILSVHVVDFEIV